ncbi:MAG: pyridoxamine 5'-phosphate oxidase family protein [Carbonactinosporaceae bacterium]
MRVWAGIVPPDSSDRATAAYYRAVADRRDGGGTAARAAPTGDVRVEELSRDESLRLLGGVPVGRVVFTARALPAIRPVTFVLDDGEVVFRAGTGSKMTAALREPVLTFEADEFDAVMRTGWSVVVTGSARRVRDPREIERVSWLLPTWLSGAADVADVVAGPIVSIRPALVWGRRITRGQA